jgi:hypothetical protein
MSEAEPGAGLGILMRRERQFGSDDLRPEYDFVYAKAVRGRYYHRLKNEGSNIVVLEPDVARPFRDSAAVNDALRMLLEMTRATRRFAVRPNRGTVRHPRRDSERTDNDEGRLRSSLSNEAKREKKQRTSHDKEVE